jgi:hypothetical protein
MEDTAVDPVAADAFPEKAAEPIIDESWTPDQLPSGWMYKRYGKLPWYASPSVQLGLVAFVCFLCPGMYNALSGLGGGGKTSTHTADQMVSFSDIDFSRLWRDVRGRGRCKGSKDSKLIATLEHCSVFDICCRRFLGRFHC